MDEILYRMQTLMDYEELDALAAAEKLGSRKAYFGALTKLTTEAPALLESLILPATPEEQRNLESGIVPLQDMLSSIGASSLLWKTEMIVGMMKTSSDKKLEQQLELLKSGIRELCGRILEARLTASAAVEASAEAGLVPEETSSATVRTKVSATPALCEKLRALIENFELDEAFAELAELRRFSYGDLVDSSLSAIRKALERLDYDGSLDETGRLTTFLSSSGADATARKKILAIDDVPDVLNSIKAILKEHYAVYCVTNHMAALKYLTVNTADLILLDIEMPDMDGFTLLEIIRRIEVYKTTPVLFLTGNVSVENIKKTVATGGNDFIRKPVDPATLLARVQKHLFPDRT